MGTWYRSEHRLWQSQHQPEFRTTADPLPAMCILSRFRCPAGSGLVCTMFSPIQSAKTRPGVDCGSDHELLIAKFRLRLKKVGKTTRLFRYDLNQIPYDYTVEVTNRCKGLDLIDVVPEELWTEVRDIVQEAVIKTNPRKTNAKRQNDCLRRPYK